MFIYMFSVNLICSPVSSKHSYTSMCTVFDELYVCMLINVCINKSLNSTCLSYKMSVLLHKTCIQLLYPYEVLFTVSLYCVKVLVNEY